MPDHFKRAPVRYALCAIATGLLLTLTHPAPAATDIEQQASRVIDQFDAKLLDVMKHADTLGYEGRYKLLEPAVDATFDLPQMTRILSGAAWRDWSDDQRAIVTAAFRRYTIATYARRFDGYGGESFRLLGVATAPSGVLVQTELDRKSETPVTISYLFRVGNGNPVQVIDVFLTGTISQLATQHSEFSAVIEHDGFDGLVRALNERAAPPSSTTSTRASSTRLF